MRVVGSTSHVGGLGRLAVAGLLAAAVGVVACGSSGSDSTSTTAKSSSTTQSKPAAAVDPSTAGPPPGGYITDFVKYVGGKAGAADSSLPPVKIGWTSNQDGSIVSIGPQATDAAQFAVDWINKYAGGVGGHPIALDKCLVKNAAEEAQKCGQQFLNDKGVNVISYGGAVRRRVDDQLDHRAQEADHLRLLVRRRPT